VIRLRVSCNLNDETRSSKLAHIQAHSEFTHSDELVAAGHFKGLGSENVTCAPAVCTAARRSLARNSLLAGDLLEDLAHLLWDVVHLEGAVGAHFHTAQL